MRKTAIALALFIGLAGIWSIPAAAHSPPESQWVERPALRQARAGLGVATADGRIFTLTDTVGFVRHLPHDLIEAFASTLEESAQVRGRASMVARLEAALGPAGWEAIFVDDDSADGTADEARALARLGIADPYAGAAA